MTKKLDKLNVNKYEDLKITNVLSSKLLDSLRIKNVSFIHRDEIKSSSIDLEKMVKSQMYQNLLDDLLNKNEMEMFFSKKNIGLGQMEYKFEAYILTPQQMSLLIQQVSKDAIQLNSVLTLVEK